MTRPILLLSLLLGASPALADDGPGSETSEDADESRSTEGKKTVAPPAPATPVKKKKPVKRTTPAPRPSGDSRTRSAPQPSTSTGSKPRGGGSESSGGGGAQAPSTSTSTTGRTPGKRPTAEVVKPGRGGGAPAPSMSTGKGPSKGSAVSEPGASSRKPVTGSASQPAGTKPPGIPTERGGIKPMEQDSGRTPIGKTRDPVTPPSEGTTGGSATRGGGSAERGSAEGDGGNGAIYGAYGVGAAAALGLAAANGASGSGTGEVVKVRRQQTLALGVRVGGLVGPKETEGNFHDFGFGLTARYRPASVVGFELTGTHYDQSWGAQSDRRHTLLSQSIGAFAFPNRTLQPYALVGVSELFRFVREDGASSMTKDFAFGPHAGVGLEIALGPRLGLDLEGRYTHFLGERTGTEPRGIVMTNLGLVFHI